MKRILSQVKVLGEEDSLPSSAVEIAYTPIYFAPRLKRFLLPLALLVFVVLSLILPWLYQRAYIQTRMTQAQHYIQTIEVRYKQLALQRPRLWPYQTQVLQEGIQAWSKLNMYVQIDTEHHVNLWHAGNLDLVDHVNKVHIIRTLEVKGQAIAHLHFMLPIYARVHEQIFIWGIALLCGLLVSISLFYVPLYLAKKSDRTHHLLWYRVQHLNQSLEDRIAQRTHALDELNQKLLRVQEEERNRISRNLHDDLGQTLTALRIQMTLAHQHSSTITQPLHTSSESFVTTSIQKSIDCVDAAVEQVRELAHTLRPAAIDELPIHMILSEHLYARCITVDLQAYTFIRLSTEPSGATKELFFRIVQEALTNIIRHTQANEVYLLLVDQFYMEKNQLEQDSFYQDRVKPYKQSTTYQLPALPAHISYQRIIEEYRSYNKKYMMIIYDNDPSLTIDYIPRFGVGLMGMQARIKEHQGVFKIQKHQEDLGLHIQVYL